ncbi:TetR/AcrR family transcriptional regulator [Clostridium sp. D2Q-11]|uniref:TetR/AcrR family transcriptional regulator n=1 Tax=Anaeromonas frigoriresistens TaxID=2683708 RepID=A0A942UYG2_9FIRM|nr:TetR/AcrR family transcriptional regulator [Anaeromonas frigoriresistens]MBS4538636.1 TetR/AcrR family transcriptional regulator [Anaeromonas frigoriresistens]
MSEDKEKSFERKEELINTAMKEFGEKGYRNASLNNILKEVGISKGTFYYHFKNKESLYIYLINMLVDRKIKFFEYNIPKEAYEKDLFELLKVYTIVGMKFAKENPYIASFSQTLMSNRDSDINKKVMNDVAGERQDYMVVLINRAYDRGEIRNDLSRNFVSNLIIHLFANIYELTSIDKIEDFEPALENLIKFLKNGLAK